MQKNIKIAFLGTGYVGLVAGTCFADKGNEVNCIDIDKNRIGLLKSCKIPFYEPGLEEMMVRNIQEGRLTFSTLDEAKLEQYCAIFISVGTPDDGSGKTDLGKVYDAFNYIKENVKTSKIIIIRSTVPTGTCSAIQSIVDEDNDLNHIICSNPEFTKEGDAINDFLNPDRVVIGSPQNKEIQNFFYTLYKPFILKENILFMSTESSELTKYTSNAFLATRISFINDIARIADKLNANIEEVSNAVGMDPRIGPHFIRAGIGYGGSCFPKDTLSLVDQANEVGEHINVLEGTIKTNDYQISYFLDKIDNYFKKNNLKKKVTLFGLSFKPNTDDLRASRGVMLYNLLKKEDFSIRCYDPMNLKFISKPIPYYQNIEDSLEGSTALIISVEDEQYKNLNFKALKENGIKAIFDGRNLLKDMTEELEGIDYFSVG
ncbi:MAG: UDP-glucose 6-dehydrogenase [Flavobacteriaceae bacterium]|nr:UDP-glucose 6-dehydrogenase [Flavobacteriaceae bacterium]